MKRYKSTSGRQLIYDSYNTLLKSWKTDFEEKDIVTSYGQTHIIVAGDPQNPPLLLFHGTADNSAMMWVYNIKELSERFYVLAVDAIGGSGKSEPNAHYYKYFDQITWIDEILAGLGIQQINICGVSYGAYLSYYYALERPSRVHKIVCLAGGIPSSQFEVMSRMMAAFLPEALFPTEKNCRKLLKKLSGPYYSRLEVNEILMKHWYYLLKYFNNRSMMQHKIQIHKDSELTILNDRVIFLIGQFDRLSNHSKAIKRLQDNKINYKIIKDAGHAINHEQSDIINKEIIEFLL
ncbi:alpha/beta fold hydrolase [Paenibacillus gallinarum]|uniref:Alpha/beta hydrolase n=1 Tax=Paenibacillus gallinarum TaxID=2762232 RepID=A0ABR8T0I3_9BACL|nr:alpha/beta hydrolase [Paenibacillus gallinarum]MBD7969263.1 alpha/beta hydrolase [Paenibacillus gallinarum]